LLVDRPMLQLSKSVVFQRFSLTSMAFAWPKIVAAVRMQEVTAAIQGCGYGDVDRPLARLRAAQTLQAAKRRGGLRPGSQDSRRNFDPTNPGKTNPRVRWLGVNPHDNPAGVHASADVLGS